MSSPSVNAAIESFVHGKEAVLSFRQLSALSDVPLRDARQHLSAYASKASDITVLYHVTTKTKTTLTTTKPSTGRVKVWAIAPKAIVLSPSVWMNGDREVMLKAASEPSHQPNALRDGRYLPIHSTSAAWDTRMDPRFGGQQVSSSSSGLNGRKASGMLNAVKSHQKRASNAVSNTKAKRSKKGLSLNGSQRESNDRTNARSASSSQGSQQQQPKSLFSSRRLGQVAADRMQASNKDSTSRKNIRKRRITCDDDDDDEDEDENKKNGQNMMEEEEEVDSEVEIERRALERERKDEDERAEVEQELQDLSNEVPEEPESPEIKDVDDDVVVEQELGVKNKEAGDGVKRSFRETFGLPPEQANGTRRIRKEVEVTVEENGYLVTRREMKTFDEHGNEIKMDAVKANDSDKENEGKSPPTSCMPSMMTPKARRANDQFKEREHKGHQSGAAGGVSKTKSQKGGAPKKSKKGKAKGKGSITSFFSKKS